MVNWYIELYQSLFRGRTDVYAVRWEKEGRSGYMPAFQSRAIMFSLLMQSGIISRFDKEPSFDRLFPNQDQHSGKGLGNLIALPLQAHL